MTDFANHWPNHFHAKAEPSEAPGFGFAGYLATGAVLAVLAGFGAIAFVNGGSPKGSGNVMMAKQTVTAAATAVESASAEPAPAPVPASPPAVERKAEAAAQVPDKAARTEAPAVTSGTLTPKAVKTVAVSPDGTIANPAGGLSADDPRWAQNMTAPKSNGRRALEKVLASQDAGPGVDKASLTSALAPVDQEPAAAQDAAVPAPTERPVVKKPATNGTIREYVNMRAEPDNDADVLEVIPAKARITIHRCRGWCEITHNGRRGFVYKSFIRRG